MEEWKIDPAHDLGLSLNQRIRSVRRERGSLTWAAHLLCLSTVGALLRLYNRPKIEGRENLPTNSSFILVANHSSHLDTILLASALPLRLRPDIFPIAAGDTFFDTPLTAIASVLFVNALPMWRKKTVAQSLADLRDRLTTQQCVFIIFPEGTRTRDGSIGRFKSGLGMLVAGTPIPVIPCRIWGTFESLPHNRRFPKPKTLRMKIAPALKFESHPNDRPAWDSIATTVQSAVTLLT